jgi:hypothetical protein
MREWPLKTIKYLTGYLLLASLHCMIAGIVADAGKEVFLFSLIYLPIVVLLCEGQKRVRYAWQYLIVIAVVIGLVQILSRDALGKGLSTVIVTGAAASFFYARARKKECWLTEPIYPYLGLFVVMYLLNIHFKNALLEQTAILGAGLGYLLCMYKANLDEMLRIIDDSARLERFPMKRLFKSNYLMMVFQTVIVVFGMCIAPVFGVDGLMNRLGQAIRQGIRWLLRGLESEEQAWGSGETLGEMQLAAAQTKELSAFMQFLLKLGEFLGWVLVIGLTLYVMYRIIKKIYQIYLQFDMNSAENGDTIEQLYIAKSKEEKQKLKKEKGAKVFGDRSPNARIRKN